MDDTNSVAINEILKSIQELMQEKQRKYDLESQEEKRTRIIGNAMMIVGASVIVGVIVNIYNDVKAGKSV